MEQEDDRQPRESAGGRAGLSCEWCACPARVRGGLRHHSTGSGSYATDEPKGSRRSQTANHAKAQVDHWDWVIALRLCVARVLPLTRHHLSRRIAGDPVGATRCAYHPCLHALPGMAAQPGARVTQPARGLAAGSLQAWLFGCVGVEVVQGPSTRACHQNDRKPCASLGGRQQGDRVSWVDSLRNPICACPSASGGDGVSLCAALPAVALPAGQGIP